jgi:hypothetical protein
MPQFDRGAVFGKWTGVVELGVDHVLARRVDVSVMTVELDRGQFAAERTGFVELRIDGDAARAVRVSPVTQAHCGEAFRESTRPLELRVRDEFPRLIDEAPAVVHNNREKDAGTRADGHRTRRRQGKHHTQPGYSHKVKGIRFSHGTRCKRSLRSHVLRQSLFCRRIESSGESGLEKRGGGTVWPNGGWGERPREPKTERFARPAARRVSPHQTVPLPKTLKR